MSTLDCTTLPWQTATKTKPIKAKPLISIMVDRSVLSKFLLDTLEGKEPLGDGAVVCVGVSNDAWQQMPKKLLAKYTVVSIDEDGWMVCEPKPDNAVNCIQVTPGIMSRQGLTEPTFSIVAQWGAQQPDGTMLQTGDVGDYVCCSRDDASDVWIVKRKIFDNTYSIKE
jgi:hypothetical protein